MGSHVPLLVVDDQTVMAEALALALRLQGFPTVELIAGNGIQADQVLAGAAAAGEGVVVLLDLHLGDAGLATAMIGPLCDAGARVLILTADRDHGRLAECLEAGAEGVFDKAQPFDQLLRLLEDAVSGFSIMSAGARAELLASGHRSREDTQRRLARFRLLTPRESDVLRGMIAGRSVEEIAGHSTTAISTVRSHVKAVLRKLGVNSQLAAVALAREAGWPDESPPAG